MNKFHISLHRRLRNTASIRKIMQIALPGVDYSPSFMTILNFKYLPLYLCFYLAIYCLFLPNFHCFPLAVCPALCCETAGDKAGPEPLQSTATKDVMEGRGTFLPHLSLLGAVQSRQLGEFLDGKGRPFRVLAQHKLFHKIQKLHKLFTELRIFSETLRKSSKKVSEKVSKISGVVQEVSEVSEPL